MGKAITNKELVSIIVVDSEIPPLLKNNSQMANFLSRTLHVAKLGLMEKINPDSILLRNLNFNEFVNEFGIKNIDTILEIIKSNEFYSDEFFLSLTESFFLTNKRIFIANKNNFNKGFQEIDILKIAGITIKKRWFSSDMIIELSNKTTIDFKKQKWVISEWKISHIKEHLYKFK